MPRCSTGDVGVRAHSDGTIGTVGKRHCTQQKKSFHHAVRTCAYLAPRSKHVLRAGHMLVCIRPSPCHNLRSCTGPSRMHGRVIRLCNPHAPLHRYPDNTGRHGRDKSHPRHIDVFCVDLFSHSFPVHVLT